MIKTTTFEEIVQEIAGTKTPEERIVLSIAFMKESISCEGKPKFRDFWRMKKTCFELFAQETNPIKKSFFWKEYSDLLKEAHRLQEIFKEEIEFHAEQIKLAITGLDSEVNNPQKSKAIALPQFDRFSELKELEQRARFFESLKEKVIALREEILLLEIRVHQKNELLDILKKIGDQVFPEYKKIISELTKAFGQKATQFFEMLPNALDKSLFKRDIRQYQALLKEIHISHESYRQFREKFSTAWKSIEDWEKEENVERTELREQDNARLAQFLTELASIPEDGSLYDKVRDLSKRSKTEIAFKENFIQFQKESGKVQDAYASKHLIEQEKKKEIEREKKALVEGKVNEILDELTKLVQKKSKASLEIMEESYSNSMHILGKTLDKRQAITLTHQLLALREIILKKREANQDEFALLNKDTKSFNDKLRKELITCGLDFDYSETLSQLIEENKKRLLSV